jgi:ParB family chromosome partitioning protein
MDQIPPVKRGLSALLASTVPSGETKPAAQGGAGAAQTVAAPASSVTTADVPLKAIRANPAQPRTEFNEEDLNELAASIKMQGLIQPIVVRRLKAEECTDGVEYELIAGERRWRASQRVGLSTVPVIIKSVFNDRDLLVLSLVENLQRADLNPVEEALAYDRLAKSFSLKHEEIADAVGKSRVAVTNALRILELPDTVREAIKAGGLTVGHAKVLAGIPDRKLQAQLGAKAQAEGMSVRDLERLVTWEERKSQLQQSAPTKVPPRERRMLPAHIEDAERRLREHFGTKVVIEEGVRKGRIIVEFYSVEDFQRLMRLMNVE